MIKMACYGDNILGSCRLSSEKMTSQLPEKLQCQNCDLCEVSMDTSVRINVYHVSVFSRPYIYIYIYRDLARGRLPALWAGYFAFGRVLPARQGLLVVDLAGSQNSETVNTCILR